MDEADWARLISQLRSGDCSPFLGSGCNATLPGDRELSETWAKLSDYPFADDGELARVMQFAGAHYRDIAVLKQDVCRHLRQAARPDFTAPGEIHSLLSRFPLPVFLTTNYDDYLSDALVAADKIPHRAICPWHDNIPYDQALFESSIGFRPGPDRPVVYHFHGNARFPDSLVLTEDDHLQFLVQVNTARARDDRRVIPPAILDALTNRPLLLLGYDLQDWTFRVLFHGLITPYPAIRRRRHVSVQLAPPRKGLKPGATARAKAYLSRYFADWNISIFWGTTQRFCTELERRMGTTP